MKKNQMRKTIVLSLIGAVVVSALVSGVTVKAQDGLTVLDKLIQLFQLAKEADSLPAQEADVGANFTVSAVPTANFNILALMTDPLTSGNNSFNNFVIERMSLVDQAASNTPLSILNSWGVQLVASDLVVEGVGTTASTSLAFYAGTSTVSGVANSTATTTLPISLMNGDIMGSSTTSGHLLTSVGNASSTLTGTEHPSIIVRPGEYLVVHCRSLDQYASCLRANSGLSDIKVSVRLTGHATSTPNY